MIVRAVRGGGFSSGLCWADGVQGGQCAFARVPIHLSEPVATLARTVASHRKGHATIGALTPSPWLFPGGQPGRPISSARLTQRLNDLDIHPSQDRSTALFQLAAEVPAAILARTLGIHTDVAVTWQRHSAGDWTTYAADVSRRTNTPTDQAFRELGYLTPPLPISP